MDSFKTWIEARKKYTGPSLFDEPPSEPVAPEAPKGDWVSLWKTTKGKGGPIPDDPVAPKPTPAMSRRFKQFGPPETPSPEQGLPSVSGMRPVPAMELVAASRANPEQFFVIGSHGRVVKVKGLHTMRDNGRVVGYDKRGHRLLVGKHGSRVMLYPDTIRPRDFMRQ